jgi:hypothetical protein
MPNFNVYHPKNSPSLFIYLFIYIYLIKKNLGLLGGEGGGGVKDSGHLLCIMFSKP